MVRFWIFPLVLGSMGAVLPFFTLWQAWAMSSFCTRRPAPLERWYLWLDLLDGTGVWMPRIIAVGAGLGMLVGLAEMRRFRDNDRKGIRAAGRLLGNVLWLSLYTLLFAISLVLVIVELQREGYLWSLWFWRSFADYAALVLLVVNLITLFWATIRTITATDVPSPRVLGRKLWASFRVIE